MSEKRIFLILCIILFWAFFRVAYSQQNDGVLLLKGVLEKMVEEDYEPLPGANIDVYQNSQKEKTLTTGQEGLFQLEMDLNKEYTIAFSKEGYVTKRIFVNTSLPEDDGDQWEVEFSIGLFEMFPGLDVSALEAPITKIRYMERERSFGYDREYTARMMNKVDKILAQLRKLKEEAYKQLIRKGDQHFDDKEYKESIQAYESALERRPDERHPERQIERAKELLEERKEGQAKYENAVAKADTLFEDEKYEDARSMYQEALSYDRTKSYPSEQIDEIERILERRKAEKRAEQEKQEKYESLIAEADSQFDEERYKTSKNNYQAALDIKPEEEYPKQRIELINDQLARLKAEKEKREQQNERYREAINTADQLFRLEEYEDARIAFNQALKIKPDEAYPAGKISEIDSILQSQKEKEKQRNLDRRYAQEIEKADELFNDKTYADAKTHYKKALQIKSEEVYPKKRIQRIEKIWQDMQASADNQNARETENNSEDSDNKEKKVENEPPSMDFNNSNERKKFQNDLAKKYPEGITVEHYDLEKRKIKRVIVNYDGIATDYRKVKHSWGATYYFRNGQAISGDVFNVETRERDQ